MIAHRTETGAAIIWRGAGAPPPPPMPIDVSALAFAAQRLDRISSNLSESRDIPPALIAGELDGLGRRINRVLADHLIAVIRRGGELMPKVEEAIRRREREKRDDLAPTDLLRLEPVREFRALAEELQRCFDALGGA